MSEALFTLRPARESDRAYLDPYCYSEGMDYLPDLENVTVAANSGNEAVGFIRIAFGNYGVAHVNPIVVHSSWRGYHVGEALMADAQARYGELRLIARGTSKGFYERLGFEACPWEEIDMTVTENCEVCTLVPECNPLPMKKGQ
ncbi:MAG: GNAT family N-acetyltransferase [Eggerthellaceae bacterium]|nr:GNAT family N-acetyltransferase [Eggerthellaceae bacterium]